MDEDEELSTQDSVANLIQLIISNKYLTKQDINQIISAAVSDDVSDDEFEEQKKENKWVSRLKQGVKRLGIGVSIATLAALLADVTLSPVTRVAVG